MGAVTVFFTPRLLLLSVSTKDNNPGIFNFSSRSSIKDFIESLGIPHVEIWKMTVNGEEVDFSHQLQDGELICLNEGRQKSYFDRQTRSTEVKLVCDVHLGKLARRLRILGFDVDYDNHRDDRNLAAISRRQNRILLSRDRHLLMRNEVTRGVLIGSPEADEQVMEVLIRLGPTLVFAPFSVCPRCNGKLTEVSRVRIGEYRKAPPRVLEWCREFKECPNCHQVYWPGSHHRKLTAWCREIIEWYQSR